MDGATVFDVGVEPRDDNRVDLELGDPWRSYAAGGFRARVDISGIDDVSPRGIDLVGSFEIRGTQLHSPAKSTTTVGMIAPSPIRDNERVTVVADDRDELSIRPVDLPESPVLVKHVGLQGRNVTVILNSESDPRELTLNTAGLRIPLAAHGRSIYTAALPELPDRYRSGGERLWTMSAKTTENRHVAVYHEAVDYLLPATSSLRLEPNPNGEVQLAREMPAGDRHRRDKRPRPPLDHGKRSILRRSSLLCSNHPNRRSCRLKMMSMPMAYSPRYMT